MKIISCVAAALLLGICGCASHRGGAPLTASAGGAQQIESAQVQVGHGQSGTTDYQTVISNPGPF